MPLYGPTPEEREEKRRQAEAHELALQCAREHREHWVIVQYRCNYSAFNGYAYTPSDYSCLRCNFPGCERVWRTKAAYVDRMVANS